MKTKLITLALLSTLLAFGQVTIDETVFVSPGGLFFSDMAINVTTNGTLEVEGQLVANADITGDDKVALAPTASVELTNGTLSLSNETDEVFSNLTVGNDGLVEVPAGNSLTLTGDLNLVSPDTALKLFADATGYAQLLTSGTISSNGIVYAEQYLSATDNAGWRQFGSPVAATFEEVDDDFLTYYPSAPGNVGSQFQWNIKYWEAVSSGTGANPLANGWQTVNNNNWAFGPASQGVGYTMYTGGNFDVLDNGNLDLAGQVGNDAYTYNTYPTSTDITTLLQSTESIGWQLIPNPYPSNIDINALLTDITSFPLAYQAVHIWDAKNQQYVAVSDDASIDLTFTGTRAGTGTTNIAPFQAFWVKGGTSAVQTVTLKNEHRTVIAQGNFFKSAPQLLRINAIASDSSVDQTIITFEPNALDEIEDRDAFKIMSLNKNMHNLYTASAGKKLAINRKAMPEPDKHIPMQFTSPTATSYEIDLVEATVNMNWQVELEDHKTGAIHDMRSSAYGFTNDPGFQGTRFTVHINKTGESLMSNNASRINIYGNDAGINIGFGYFIASKTADVLITNLAGQILYNGTVDTEEPFLFPVNDDVAMYVVHVIAGDKISQEKVVLGN